MPDESPERTKFLEAIAIQVDYWAQSLSERLSQPGSDLSFLSSRDSAERVRASLIEGKVEGGALREVLATVLNGLSISVLTAIDEGTPQLGAPPLRLVDPSGDSLGPLHEAFVAHLIDTGRMPLPNIEWSADEPPQRHDQ
jgi:hypothetical protein